MVTSCAAFPVAHRHFGLWGWLFHPGNGGSPRSPAPVFSWDDPYVGVFGFDLIFAIACDEETEAVSPGSVDIVEICYLYPNQHGAGVQAGYSFGNGALVIGPEVQFGTILLDEPRWAVAANVRGGLVLDERLLVYAEGGIGTSLDPRLSFVSLGGGLKLSLGRRVSVFGEAKGVWVPDLGPDFVSAMVQVGLNFHLAGGVADSNR